MEPAVTVGGRSVCEAVLFIAGRGRNEWAPHPPMVKQTFNELSEMTPELVACFR